MMKSSERRADGSRLDCLHPLSFLLHPLSFLFHPTHPLARAIFIFSSLTHPLALLIRSIVNFQRMPWDTESLVSQTEVHFNCKTVYNCRNYKSYFISWIYNDSRIYSVSVFLILEFKFLGIILYFCFKLFSVWNRDNL